MLQRLAIVFSTIFVIVISQATVHKNATMYLNEKYESISIVDVVIPAEDRDERLVSDFAKNFVENFWSTIKSLSTGDFVKVCIVIRFLEKDEPNDSAKYVSFNLMKRNDPDQQRSIVDAAANRTIAKIDNRNATRRLLVQHCRLSVEGKYQAQIAIFVRKYVGNTPDWFNYVQKQLIPERLKTINETLGFYIVTNNFGKSSDSSVDRLVSCQFNDGSTNCSTWNGSPFDQSFHSAADQIKSTMKNWLARCNYTAYHYGQCYHRGYLGDPVHRGKCKALFFRVPSLADDHPDQKFCVRGPIYRDHCDDNVCKATCAKYEHYSNCNATVCGARGYKKKFVSPPTDQDYIWHCPAYVDPVFEPCVTECDSPWIMILFVAGIVSLIVICAAAFAAYWFMFRKKRHRSKALRGSRPTGSDGKQSTPAPLDQIAKKSKSGGDVLVKSSSIGSGSGSGSAAGVAKKSASSSKK